MSIFSSFIQHARDGWNAFNGRDPTRYIYNVQGSSYSYRPDRPTLTRGIDRSLVNSIYNCIANDVAQIKIIHARVDDNGNYASSIESPLNNCLSLEANLDQTGRAFIQDVVLSMFDEGCVAVVPVDTNHAPWANGGLDIYTMRTGRIMEWYPDAVKVKVYNERTGRKEELILRKTDVAIIENPFYNVMNEPNSTLQRLIRKLNLLDAIDERSNSGKLDLVIQLPYALKGDVRRQQADARRKDIEMQLTGTKYGIAYIDSTEHITQLNRPLDNNLREQIKDLKEDLYGQLGLTQAILDGSASEQEMLNYYNRTVEPILSAICDEYKRKFLTKTARSQKQSIVFFRDPFKLVPVSQIADIADKFTRNEILSSNEVRGIVGYRPSDDPKADELRNKNLNQSVDEIAATPPKEMGADIGMDQVEEQGG